MQQLGVVLEFLLHFLWALCVKKLLIHTLLSGTARAATIVAALKDIQVVEVVTSSLLPDYSATSEGAHSLPEDEEWPVALKQQDTLQSPA